MHHLIFYYIFNIYIFLAVSGFSCCAQALPAARGRLSSCGTWAPEHAGSVVVACGLSCSMACGISVPWPGIEPAFPTLEGGFLTTGPPGSPQYFIILNDKITHTAGTKSFADNHLTLGWHVTRPLEEVLRHPPQSSERITSCLNATGLLYWGKGVSVHLGEQRR